MLHDWHVSRGNASRVIMHSVDRQALAKLHRIVYLLSNVRATLWDNCCVAIWNPQNQRWKLCFALSHNPVMMSCKDHISRLQCSGQLWKDGFDTIQNWKDVNIQPYQKHAYHPDMPAHGWLNSCIVAQSEMNEWQLRINSTDLEGLLMVQLPEKRE